jgi:NAD(P)-binding Rossmann-like domain
MPATDYLIIGSGAVGMTFADQLLTDTNANIVIVDRHHMPGGHWNDAYSFVRLHQPSAFYGVGSSQLGSNRIDVSGLNRGYYELASGAEIVSYFDKLMQERFLPSGRVQYFPMCDYLGDGRFVSLLSGAIQQVAFKRLVHATFLDTQVPSTHTPSFQVAEHIKLVTPNLLPISAPGHQRFAILGGGKTGMDVGIWLLQMGVRPENIRWIMPRDSWLQNRDTTSPATPFSRARSAEWPIGSRRRPKPPRSRISSSAWNKEARCYALIGLYCPRCIVAPRSRSSKWKP